MDEVSIGAFTTSVPSRVRHLVLGYDSMERASFIIE
jgi:hypothetical protein